MSRKIKRHFIIPDTQLKPKVPTAHLEWAGKYILDKKPDVIVMLGDWWDMPSLSTYDGPAKKAKAGYTVMADYNAGVTAMERFMAPWFKKYKPRHQLFLMGNHENRINRYFAQNAENDSLPDPAIYLRFRGWKVAPFLQPVKVDGITYCHYFCRNATGRVTNSRAGQPSAKAQGRREMCSTVSGHKQGLDTDIHEANGRRVRSVIAGSFYQHSEGYLSPQGNAHWQGCLMLNDVRNGDYQLSEVGLDFLRRKYR